MSEATQIVARCQRFLGMSTEEIRQDSLERFYGIRDEVQGERELSDEDPLSPLDALMLHYEMATRLLEALRSLIVEEYCPLIQSFQSF